jgi:glycosyltransferase involved in cell wall biosynthesis
MKIAILGTHGIPNNYGGFEEFAENLAGELTKKNHQVAVYCPENHVYKEKSFNNIDLIKISFPSGFGGVSQLIYDYKCLIDATKKDFDVVLMCGYGCSPLYIYFKKKIKFLVTNLDGLEWKRSKWNFFIKKYLRWAEKIAIKKSDISIADHVEIQTYFEKSYGRKPEYVAYGANLFEEPDESELETFGLKPNEYFLIVSRIEPENNVELIIKGFLSSDSAKKMVIVSSIETNNYSRSIYRKYKDHIVFLKDIYEKKKLNNLRFFSSLYFHGHEVGGTNPSLLEAMACRCRIVAHNNVFNKMVLNNGALFFNNQNDLSQIINCNTQYHFDIEENVQRIVNLYNWKGVAAKYEQIFFQKNLLN